LLKFTNGLTLDYDTAKEDLKVVKTKRYTTAYIVAIKDGKNISIQEALNNYNKSNILY
jgi:N-acetylmuramoyl-L-alanine amidase